MLICQRKDYGDTVYLVFDRERRHKKMFDTVGIRECLAIF